MPPPCALIKVLALSDNYRSINADLDVARCCLWLFTLYINIKISKIVVKC